MATTREAGKKFFDEFRIKPEDCTPDRFEPAGDRLLVRRAKPKEKQGNILLPQTAQTKMAVALVVAVGPGRLNDKGERAKIQFSAGDVVYLSKWGGTESEEFGEEYLIITEADVLGKMTE